MNLVIENPVLVSVYAWVKNLAIMASYDLRQKAKDITESATDAYKNNWNSNFGWSGVFELKDNAACFEAKATEIENLNCFRNLWIFSGWKSVTWTTEMILVLKKEIEQNSQFYEEYHTFQSSNASWELNDKNLGFRSFGEKKVRYGELRRERIQEEIVILEKLGLFGEKLRLRIYPEVDQDEAGNILADFYYRILTGKIVKPF